MTVQLKRRYMKTIDLIKNRPVLGTIPWSDIEKLFKALGAEIEERRGSRVAVILNGEVQVFHRPHPENVTDKGAVISVKNLIEAHFPDLME